MYVNYEIDGYSMKFQAGPFSEKDIEAERSDIAGYSGVTSCYIVSSRDPKRTLIGGSAQAEQGGQ